MTKPASAFSPRHGTYSSFVISSFDNLSSFGIRHSKFRPAYLPPSAGVSAGASPPFLRLAQLYLRWNFSTRPVVSRNFILPVKNGWQAEQISTVMFFLVLRVTNL